MDAHAIPIRTVAHLDAEDRTSAGVPANVYRSGNYVVADVGLPRCLPEHIAVSLAPDALLVEAERHPGTGPTEQERDFALHELPSGPVRRRLPLPAADLDLGAAAAHFANGMLTVSIPTTDRAEHRRAVRGEL
jgi:HSP20 family protein